MQLQVLLTFLFEAIQGVPKKMSHASFEVTQEILNLHEKKNLES